MSYEYPKRWRKEKMMKMIKYKKGKNELQRITKKWRKAKNDNDKI